jgi:hypothetical protein
MKELKRNATCALLAWSRAEIHRLRIGPARGHQPGGRTKIQWAFDDRVKQQYRKQEKIHQCFDLFPDGPVQRGVPADQIAAQDKGEIGE